MPDPRYKALLIGNAVYDREPHLLATLKGPPNDVRVLRTALTHPEFGLFDPKNVRHVLDGTHSEVLEAVETFFTESEPGDHLLFYYSGHGFPDGAKNLYLCARNTRTTLLGSTAISDTTINQMAKNCEALKFIFILDCCHSGGFKGGAAGEQLAQGSGRCLITACASTELSADAGDGSGTSTFTRYLAEALVSGEVDTDGDGAVDMAEVVKFVKPRVYKATKQTVQWSPDKTFGDTVIARARPRAAGGESAVSEVKLAPESGRPVLELSEARIENREVQPGEVLPVDRIEVTNAGDGALDWFIECEEPWIAVERKGDSLFVKLDTSQPGTRRGNIFVRDRGRGGSRTIRVLLQVLELAVPRLVASPSALDFGMHARGTAPKLEVRVSNGGAGRLQWEVESGPPEVIVSRHEQGLTLELAASFLGTLKGALRLKGNGGSVELPLTATILPPLPVTPQFDPLVQAVQGWWMNDAGAFHIRLEGGALVYTDYNLMSINVGQGTIQVQNGLAQMQGFNSFAGPYTGQFTVQGQMITGSLTGRAGTMPLMFMRQQPWFASFRQ